MMLMLEFAGFFGLYWVFVISYCSFLDWLTNRFLLTRHVQYLQNQQFNEMVQFPQVSKLFATNVYESSIVDSQLAQYDEVSFEVVESGVHSDDLNVSDTTFDDLQIDNVTYDEAAINDAPVDDATFDNVVGIDQVLYDVYDDDTFDDVVIELLTGNETRRGVHVVSRGVVNRMFNAETVEADVQNLSTSQSIFSYDDIV